MLQTRRYIFIATIFFLGACATTADKSRSEGLELITVGGDYVLTVPISRLTMKLPKGGLLPRNNNVGGSAANLRYFYFEDHALSLIVSGWFEPDRLFRGITAFWEGETKSYKQKGLPEPRNVSFLKIGNWDAIVYDLAFPRGTNTHIRASWVQAGTWIDVHMSITSDRPTTENRVKLEAILRSISLEEKK